MYKIFRLTGIDGAGLQLDEHKALFPCRGSFVADLEEIGNYLSSLGVEKEAIRKYLEEI